jgi:hypothetical protein
MRHLFTLGLLCFTFSLWGQQNTQIIHSEVNDLLFGNFDPADYAPSTVIEEPGEIAADLIANINPDSLRSYLEQLSTFTNRNTGADTTSNTFGMGAARRWAFDKFKEFSAQAEDRLQVSYVQFQILVCGMFTHRNVIAVLPGQGTHYDEVVLVEAHIDSRCEDACDVDCDAHGMEDNGSGTALVLEMARVMSQYSFDRTVVFLLTTGEEQGLHGAKAFADYCFFEEVKLKAVLNNDVIGGIICGETASPPGCPGLNDIDSTNVRIYSQGSFNSRHKQLARFIKLEYEELISPIAPVPTVINIMTPEDRVGRGGDHMPFRQKGFPAVRFTSANEHGDGNPSQPDYHDRQHTMEDILGLDTDGDGALDSFFVDFNYLARNAVVNGNALAVAASGPQPPEDFAMTPVNNGFAISIDDPNNYGTYRVGVRDYDSNDWDTVFTIQSTQDTIYGLEPGNLYVLSAATVDDQGRESLFSNEEFDSFTTGTVDRLRAEQGVTLLQNNPNPFDEATAIGVRVEAAVNYQEAFIAVFDLEGRELARLPIELKPGLNEVIYGYEHHRYVPGTYAYSLVVDGKVLASKQMIYAY